MLVCIVRRDILLNYIPASTHRAMVAAWSPEMVTVPFLQIGKILPVHSATSTFDHLRYITYGILWRVFDKQMHMIRVYCHINDLTYGLPRFFQYLNDTEINMSSNGWWPGPYRRELRKIMESGWKSDLKKARGLDGEIEKVFGERERLRG